jgi:hypothetical protein
MPLGSWRRAAVHAASAALRASAATRLLTASRAVRPLPSLLRGHACAEGDCRPGGPRWLASQAAPAPAPAVPLKTLLRQLFLKVHPDLFTDAPQEQATNQKSFILLQEYLAQAESGTEPHGRAQKFDFVFFIREDTAGDQGADSEDGAARPRGALRRVAVALPPPGRRQPGQDPGRCVSPCGVAMRVER